jgi:hypothetical protein
MKHQTGNNLSKSYLAAQMISIIAEMDTVFLPRDDITSNIERTIVTLSD